MQAEQQSERERFEAWFCAGAYGQRPMDRFGSEDDTFEIWCAALVAAQEREACAMVCEAEHLEDPQDGSDDAYDCAVNDCVAAIRARKEET